MYFVALFAVPLFIVDWTSKALYKSSRLIRPTGKRLKEVWKLEEYEIETKLIKILNLA